MPSRGLLDVPVVTRDHHERFVSHVGEDTRQESVDALEGRHCHSEVPVVPRVVRPIVGEEREVSALRDPRQVATGVLGTDTGDLRRVEMLPPAVVQDVARDRLPVPKVSLVPGEGPGRTGRERRRGHATRLHSLRVAAWVGVREGDAASSVHGPSEEIRFREERAQLHRSPRSEVTTEDPNRVHSGQEGRLPGATLRSTLHAHRGVQRNHRCARPRGPRLLERRDAPQQRAERGHLRSEERIPVRVVRTDPYPVQEEEERTSTNDRAA